MDSTIDPTVTTKEVYDYCVEQVAEIEALPKKSNYHNARRSTFKAIKNLISPPPPKPVKEKKEPKAKAAAAGETGAVTDANTGEVVEQVEATGDTGAA